MPYVHEFGIIADIEAEDNGYYPKISDCITIDGDFIGDLYNTDFGEK